MFNPYSQSWQGQSIYGALPYSSPDALPTFFSFRFTSLNPTVLNCTVIGPKSRPYFRITTDTPMPGVSVFQNSNGQNIALVQWHRHPEVELRNIVARQRVSGMLSLSPDQTYRRMTVNGATFTFTPRDNFIWTTVTLELTGEAIHIGLLEPALVATFLLQCGRNID
ncbi:hypothetical protein DFH08DRAFT_708274 [Mycena albidolilacea]|uniref:Uncharacterized protein n=1 Tax=Mycena albidolilacea TaxID=1033008 RepID=A0AAD7EJQ1_9AGAR|nr:hypothetical protein DFH08DRAFT_708274 [Mycena albidolilacea]